MLPEGGHNRGVDSTYFVVQRKKNKDLQLEGKPYTDVRNLFSKIFPVEQTKRLQAISGRKYAIRLF